MLWIIEKPKGEEESGRAENKNKRNGLESDVGSRLMCKKWAPQSLAKVRKIMQNENLQFWLKKLRNAKCVIHKMHFTGLKKLFKHTNYKMHFFYRNL